ncbi:hypothetical protein H7R52_17250 [Weissella confusa]|uniref:DUF1700 domain-containing protein n=1 Tax=Weissella confusa TaxID=1583 RepID=A0A923SQB8_WEICO|nr:hypothetical protein [Weissella confusa]
MVNEYLADVRSYMAGVPENEREELLQFYEEQMIDAGLTSDQIVEKYGTPKDYIWLHHHENHARLAERQ